MSEWQRLGSSPLTLPPRVEQFCFEKLKIPFLAFDLDAKRLLGCRDAGFVPWRLGHALLCVAPSCDDARLVRRLAAPTFLGALGLDLDLEELLIYRLGHWKDLPLGCGGR